MKNTLVSALVAVVVSLTVSLLGIGSPDLGGTIENFPTKFINGLSAGPSEELSVSSAGNLSAPDLTASDDLIVGDDAVIGASAASSSGLVGSFIGTATVSVGFDGGSGKGTCLEMTNTAGTRTYVRIFGTTLTANTTSCK